MLGESFNWLARFSRIGLLGGFGEPKTITLGDNGQWMGDHCGHTLIIEGQPEQMFKMRTFFSPYMASLITVAGMELAKLCQHHDEPDHQYLSHVAALLAKQDCKLKLAKILNQTDEHVQYSDPKVVEPFVEPEEHDQQEPNNAE